MANLQAATKLLGERFTRLLVIEKTNERRWDQVVWICLCDCGQIVKVPTAELLRGHNKSCGCYGREISRIARIKSLTKHGQCGTKEYRCYRSNRRYALKLKRTPEWADQEKIREVYINCPDGYQVDHIYPMQGKLVSGLNVPENLQYLTIQSNRLKSNKFEPEFIVRGDYEKRNNQS